MPNLRGGICLSILVIGCTAGDCWLPAKTSTLRSALSTDPVFSPKKMMCIGIGLNRILCSKRTQINTTLWYAQKYLPPFFFIWHMGRFTPRQAVLRSFKMLNKDLSFALLRICHVGRAPSPARATGSATGSWLRFAPVVYLPSTNVKLVAIVDAPCLQYNSARG